MTKILVDTSKITKDEWHSYRRMGIGGSDVAPICGLSPWVSPKMIYHQKKGTVPNIEENDAMYWGTALEPLILAEFLKRHEDLECVKPTYIYQSSSHPFMLANLDGVVGPKGDYTTTGIFEAKTASSEEGWEETIPDYYMLQVQHYMHVMQYDFTWLAVLFSGRKYRDYYIPRDQDIIDHIIRIEQKFWEDFQNNIEPDVVISDKYLLDSLYKNETEGKEVELPEFQTNVDIILDARKEIKRLQDIVTYNENLIKDKMADAETAVVNKAKVTWKTIARSGYTVQATSYRKFDVRLPKERKEK